MTNHVHLLLTPAASRAAARLMQSLGRRYVQYVNRFYRRTGSLWDGRYKSSVIHAEDYLLACQRYIELNPVRAGMVDDPGQYRWSSYRSNGLQQHDRRLTPHLLYQSLGNSPKPGARLIANYSARNLMLKRQKRYVRPCAWGCPWATCDFPKASVGDWESGGIPGKEVIQSARKRL